jgi:hypothetical protein
MPLDVVLHGLVYAVLSFLSVDGFDIESARAKSRVVSVEVGPATAFDARDDDRMPAPINYPRPAASSAIVWRAIMSSSSVGTT